jgi:hypothetical protein
VSSENYGGSKIATIIGYWYGLGLFFAGHYFEFLIHRRFVLNKIPFPVSTAKFTGNFYNRQSMLACWQPGWHPNWTPSVEPANMQ